MARKMQFDFDVDGVPVVKGALDSVGHSIDNIGDEASQAERKLSRLGRQIEETALKSKLLATQFNETGDTAFFKEFGKNESALAGLKRMEKALTDTESKAAKLNKTLNVGGKKKGGFSEISARLGPLSGLPPQALAGIAGGVAVAGAAVAVPAVLGAAGLGGIAAGIIAQAKDPKVVSAFGDLGQSAKAELLKATTPFADELVKSAHIFDEELTKAGPGLEKTFAALARDIEPLSRGVAGAIGAALPGIERAARSAEPLFKEMSRDLPALGRSVGTFFGMIASDGPAAAQVFHSLTTELDAMVLASGGAITAFGKIAGGLAEFDNTSHLFFGPHLLTGPLGLLGAAMEDTGKKTKDAADQAAAGAGSWTSLFDAMKKTDDEATNLNSTLDDLFNAEKGSQDAAIGWEQSLDDLTTSVKENGTSLDIHTQKGRNNALALEAAADQAKRARDEAINLAIANGSTVADATDKANAKYNQQIDDLEALGRKLGLTKAQMDQLLQSYRDLAKAPDINKRINFVVTGGGTVGPLLSGGRGVRAFAEGGPVPGPPGAAQLAVVHGGEYVVPRSGVRVDSSGGGASMQAVLSLAPGIDSELGRLLMKVIRVEVRSQGGSGRVLGITS